MWEMKENEGLDGLRHHAVSCNFSGQARARAPAPPENVLIARTTREQPGSACDWHPIFLGFQHHSHAFFSRIGPVRKPCGSRSTCHCHVGLCNRSAVEKMAPKVSFAKQKQLAQKTVGSRDHRTSRVCSGLVDGVAQGCNIRSPVALA
jgi:hypothetical protein